MLAVFYFVCQYEKLVVVLKAKLLVFLKQMHPSITANKLCTGAERNQGNLKTLLEKSEDKIIENIGNLLGLEI